MSRFFASGYTSDSSSEEEDLLSTSEEELLSSSEEFSTDSEFENDEEPSSDDSDLDYDGQGPSYFLKKDFLKGGADLDSDSDNEGRKVVKSGKEKLLDDVTESVDSIYNGKNLENWTAVLTEFDRLQKLLVKVNQQKITTPNYYYKMLAQLEETITEATNEKRKLPADQSRAFNNVRQRVKKQVKEFLAHMELYQTNPEAFDADEPVDIGLASANDDSGAVVGTVSGTARVMSPVFTALKLIAETRGKKNVDRYEQVAQLERLLTEAQVPFERISVYQMLLSVRFDAGQGQPHMPLELWKDNERDVNGFLDLLQSTKEYQVSEAGLPTDDMDVEPTANAAGVKVIQGSVLAVVERLDDEFAKSLQNTDPHLIEYIERLRDELGLYKLIVRAQVYVQATLGSAEHLARIVLKRLDHIHYKPDQLISVLEEAAWKDVQAPESPLTQQNQTPSEVVGALCGFLGEQDNALYKKSALLCRVFYLAVNNHYSDARAQFLDSQIYNSIANADSAVQVLYNRALVQLGLGAFKAGEIEELHQILNEIINSQRLKELLGQGFNSKYPSQATNAEKQKLLPFHMHINLELLECVFMTALLLIEIPMMAAASASTAKDLRRKTSIKSFKSKLEFHDRQYFTGPPESIKDHLIYASRFLQKGSWAKAYDLLSLIKIWKLFPDTASLLLMLRSQLQVEGLRTYILTFRSIYSKLLVAKLAEQFQLEEAVVQQIVEKMLAGDLAGLLENGFINFGSDEPQRSKLQELAIVMNEKVGLLNEKNEKTASNGHGRKQAIQQQQQQQKEQKEAKESLQEENSRFRYANVNTNNDEFQVTA